MFHISCSHSGFWFHTLSHFAVTKRSHCSLGTFLGDRGHERRRRRPSSDICHRPAVWSSWPSNTSAEVLGDNEVKTFISIEGSRIWMRKSKGNQGRYRIIDCTIYIHHQFSSIIHSESSIIHHESSIIHQSCIYIWCYSHTYKDLLHQTVKTYCYRQNNFLLTSAPLIRSASKTSMSCLSFCERADSSQVSSLEPCSLCDFKSPGLPMISSGYHGRWMSFSKISTINNCCLWRHKHVFKEYKTRNI